MASIERKEDYADALATLLSLDRGAEHDLLKLPINTLAQMYNNYIQNAKDVNAKLERVMKIEATSNQNKPQPTASRYKDLHRA